MNRKSFLTSVFFFFLLFAVFFWSACQRAGGANPWGNHGDWTVDTVYTEPTTFSPGGWGFVYARILDQETGEPYESNESMRVTFKSSVGDSIFDSRIVSVGANGIAMTRISLASVTDSSESLIVIEASIDYPAYRSNMFYLRVGDAPVYAYSIILDAYPDTLFEGSTDSFQVSAVVQDSTGSALPGVVVHLERVSGAFIIPAGPFVTGASGAVSIMIPAPGEPGESVLRAFGT